MGGVFLAEDSTLGRPVAIKLISEKTAFDGETRNRFLGEARAMATVEHPNVVRIYSFGEEPSGPYIVMEFIEGESLADRLRREGRLAVGEALSIALQVADGLDAAWKKGVVHRDVKPSNVLLDRSGRVHVADFGLAKHLAADPGVTATGAILGTPHYIPPEQARGERVDFRSDMYSLGIVLYEMLAGEKPFKGSSPAVVVAQHLEKPLPSLREVMAGIPPPLAELVEAMADKDPARRPASYAELQSALKSLVENATVPRLSPARSSKAVRIGMAAGLAGLALVSFLLVTVSRFAQDSTSPSIAIEKITNRGTVWGDPILSPDERYIAYLARETGEYLIWLKDVSEGTEVRLAGPLEPEFPTLDFFSSDSRYVYYTQVPKGHGLSHLFRIPVIGGQPRPVVEGYGARMSPDGKRLLFLKDGKLLVSNADGGEARQLAGGDIEGGAAWSEDGRSILAQRPRSLFVVDVDSGREQEVSTLPAEYEFAGVGPARRPQSDVAAVVFRASGDTSVVSTVDLANGATRVLEGSWQFVQAVQWLPDGDALIVNGALMNGRASQIWLVSFPDGARKAVLPDPAGDYGNAVITPDGKRILATHDVERSDVLVSTRGDSFPFRRVLTGTDVDYSLCWTMNGELIVSSNEAGTYDLYVLNPESGLRRQLTTDSAGDERVPAVSSDGRYAVFVGESGGQRSVWRIGLDGAGLMRLTPPAREGAWIRPQVSPDGEWVLFQDWDGGPQISMVPIDGGASRVIKGPQGVEPSPFTPTEYAFGGAWSPTGRELAFFYFTYAETWSPMEIVTSSPGGQIQKRFAYGESKSPALKEHQHLQWSPDGRYLYFANYVRDGNLWRQPIGGGPAVRVTSEDLVGDFDWSADGESLALSRVTRLSEVVLITNFR
jgi:serine/threonine-protein kinase